MKTYRTPVSTPREDLVQEHGHSVADLLARLESNCIVRVGPTAYVNEDGYTLAQQDRLVQVWRNADPAMHESYYTKADPDEVYLCTDAGSCGGPVGPRANGLLIIEEHFTGGDYPIDADTGMELRFDD